MSEQQPRPRARGRRAPSQRWALSAVRRASVVGAGSFGTALAVLLTRAGLRVTLQTRSPGQAELRARERENRRYLPGVELPAQLTIEPSRAGASRADLMF